MIDNDKLRETVVTGIKNYLQIPFIQSNQNAEPPAYPFISFTVTQLESANKGTWSEYDDGKDRQAVTQTWSISSLSDDENESITNASKAREWFDRVGRLYLKDNGVIVQSVGAITNRDNVLTTEYEYKNGFDVVFYMLSEVENPITESGQYIETAKIENIQVKNNESTLNDLIGVEDVSDPVKQIEIANTLGRNNLESKKVVVAKNATTYEIMKAIEQTEEVGSYDKGYSEGQNSISNPLEYAASIMYAGAAFPDGYELEIDVPNIVTLENIFFGTKGIKKVTIKGNTNGIAIDFINAFSGIDSNNPSPIEVVDMTDLIIKPKDCDQAFFQAQYLREIKGDIDLRECISASRTFVNCYALEEIRFLPESIAYIFELIYSPLLSAETRQNIVEALSPVGGTLKLHSEVTAKFTSEQVLEITSKNWRIQ